MQPPTVRESLENLLLSSEAEHKKLSQVCEEFSLLLHQKKLFLEAGAVATCSVQIRAWEVLESATESVKVSRIGNGK